MPDKKSRTEKRGDAKKLRVTDLEAGASGGGAKGGNLDGKGADLNRAAKLKLDQVDSLKTEWITS